MKKIISIIIALVLVLGVAWAGSSWWFGRQVESRYRQLAARAAQLSGAEIDVESYQRGLRTSTARTRIVLPAPQVKGTWPTLEFTVTNEIVSGPFPGGAAGLRPAMALVRSRVALGDELLKEIRKEFPAFPAVLPLTSTTVVYFGGNGESWTSAPAVRQTLGGADPLTVDWQGLEGHSTFKAGFSECRGEWQMSSLEVTSAKSGRLKLTGLGSTFDMRLPQGLDGLVLGDFQYGIKTLALTDSGEKGEKGAQFTLQDLMLKSSSWETEGAVNAILKASFRSLTVEGVSYGPGVYDMQLTNFDAEALHEIQQLSRSIRNEPGISPQQMQAEMLAGIGKLWPRFAARSPGIEIRDLSVKGPDGRLHCTGKIAIDGNNKLALASPLLATQAVTAETSAEVSAPMLRKMVAAVVRQELVKSRTGNGQPPLSEQQLDAMAAANGEQGINALVEKHILVPKGDDYTLSVSYRPGAATLNGQPIPLH